MISNVTLESGVVGGLLGYVPVYITSRYLVGIASHRLVETFVTPSSHLLSA